MSESNKDIHFGSLKKMTVLRLAETVTKRLYRFYKIYFE